jgi:hypothetical protein
MNVLKDKISNFLPEMKNKKIYFLIEEDQICDIENTMNFFDTLQNFNKEFKNSRDKNSSILLFEEFHDKMEKLDNEKKETYYVKNEKSVAIYDFVKDILPSDHTIIGSESICSLPEDEAILLYVSENFMIYDDYQHFVDIISALYDNNLSNITLVLVSTQYQTDPLSGYDLRELIIKEIFNNVNIPKDIIILP